jgi:hypothetical protein
MALSESLWLTQQVQISAANRHICCSSHPCSFLEARNSKHNHCLCNCTSYDYVLMWDIGEMGASMCISMVRHLAHFQYPQNPLWPSHPHPHELQAHPQNRIDYLFSPIS